MLAANDERELWADNSDKHWEQQPTINAHLMCNKCLRQIFYNLICEGATECLSVTSCVPCNMAGIIIPANVEVNRSVIIGVKVILEVNSVFWMIFPHLLALHFTAHMMESNADVSRGAAKFLNLW